MFRTVLRKGILSTCSKDISFRNSLTNEEWIGVRQMTSFVNKFYWKPIRKKANPRPKFPVILLEDDEQLGRKGEVVKVERGYARHVLIPERRADYAIRDNLEMHDFFKGGSKPRASLKFVNKLKSMQLIMQRPADESWEISKHHIAFAFKNNFKLHVPVHCIQSDFEAISEFGEYEITVTVNGESTVPVQVLVQEWQPVYEKDWKDILFNEANEEEEDKEAS